MRLLVRKHGIWRRCHETLILPFCCSRPKHFLQEQGDKRLWFSMEQRTTIVTKPRAREHVVRHPVTQQAVMNHERIGKNTFVGVPANFCWLMLPLLIALPCSLNCVLSCHS